MVIKKKTSLTQSVQDGYKFHPLLSFRFRSHSEVRSVRPVTAPAAKTYRSQEHPLRNGLLETTVWNWNVFLQTCSSNARLRVECVSARCCVRNMVRFGMSEERE